MPLKPGGEGEKRLLNRRDFLTTASAVGIATTAGCTRFGVGGQGPVKAGLLSPISGPYTAYGRAHKRGFELAIDKVNENGGINGRDVEVVVKDTETDPAVGTERAQELVREDEVDFASGTFSSAVRNAVAPVITQADTVMLYPTNYEGQTQENFPGVCNELMFMFGLVPSQQATPWVEHMANEFGDNFYLVGNDYAFPQISFERISAEIENIGGNVVQTSLIPFGTTDHSSTLARIEDSNADIVIEAVVGTDGVSFATQFYNQGLNSDFTLWSIDDEESMTEAKGPESSAGTYISLDWFYALETQETQEFLSRLHDKHGEGTLMNYIGADHYNAGLMAAKAANEVGSVETDDLIEGLEGMTIQGVQGEITMREQDHQAVLPSYLTVTNDGWDGYGDMFNILDNETAVTPQTAECDFPLSKG